jgi:hypothetical protein
VYEGWHIEFSDHAKKRMVERMVSEEDVLSVLSRPEEVEANDVQGAGCCGSTCRIGIQYFLLP